MSHRVFVDLDGVLADYDRYAAEHKLTHKEMKKKKGAFAALEVYPHAVESVQKLMEMGFEVYIAAKICSKYPHIYAEKMEWIARHFPELKKRVIITPNKGLLGDPDDFLCDDEPDKAHCREFPGKLLEFKDGYHWPQAMAFFRAHRPRPSMV